jgi:predicted alpha/beta-hydrolase family hydrolase
MLVALAGALAGDGVTVLRCDLPFRQVRPSGPPSPAGAARDRDGLRRAVAVVRSLAGDVVFLGGHSYGGRQATMLAADEPAVADGLLVLSYPLRPPRGRAPDRTAHFSRLRTPALFVHGSRDAFGSPADVRAALAAIPARTELLDVPGAGHDLGGGRTAAAVAARIAAAFRVFADRPD